MKKIYRYFFAAVAIASAASCAEQMENDQVSGGQAPAEFAQMTISASLGEVTKTTYDNQSVLWEGTESITVFSKGSENSPAQFDMDWCSEDKTKASFTGLADLNAESYYAVYPDAAAKSCTSEGVLTVEIPATQTAVADGFASGANVAVAAWQKSENDIIFNNVCSLISFSFETDADAVLTKSVTIKVKKNSTDYYKIAGDVSVNYDPEGDHVVSEGTVDNIVLNAPTGGFAKGVTYYVPIAPVGEIAQMELTYTHTDGVTTCERKNSNIVASLTRSTLVPLETIPVAYDDLPQEDFDVPIDFTGEWPFETKVIGSDDQDESVGKDQYTYKFEYGESKSLSMNFGVQRGQGSDNRYEHNDGKLKFTGSQSGGGGSYGLIHIPEVNGRYVKKVAIDYECTVRTGLLFKNGTFGYQDGNLFTYYAETSDTSVDIEWKSGYDALIGNSKVTYKTSKAEYVSGSYDLRLRNPGFIVKKLVITYSKDNPSVI